MEERPRYRNGILVYTAKDIHDDVAGGMDPDCLFVGLEKFDALRTELARVKAESLRVVPVGDAVPFIDFISRAGGYHIEYGGNVLHVSGPCAVDENGHTDDAVCLDTFVQPVRLERWGDEG